MPPPIAGVDGAWACPGCGNVNFAVRQACNRCQAPRPADGAPALAAGGRGGPPADGVDGNWKCPFCGNVNFAVRHLCNRCQAPNAEQSKQSPAAGANGGAGRGPPPVSGVDGNWKCEDCGNINFAVRNHCNRCQAPRQSVSREDVFDQLFAQEQLVNGLAEFVAPAAPQSQDTPRRGPPHAGGRGPPQAGVDGNWACQQCGNVNFVGRHACNLCQAPKPPDHQPQQPQHAQQHKGRPIAGVDGNWMCPQCQNVNFPARTGCNRCGAPQPASNAQSAAQPTWPAQRRPAQAHVADGNWVCPSCQNVNYPGRTACNRCMAPMPTHDAGAGAYVRASRSGGAPAAGVNGNWACVSCGNVNYAAREVCNRCQAPKPSDDVFAQEAAALLQEVSWHGGGGGGARQGGGGRPIAGVDGNWLCPLCQNVNFAVRQVCNRCQAPNPDEAGASAAAMDYAQFAQLTEESDLGTLLADHPELGDSEQPPAKKAKRGA